MYTLTNNGVVVATQDNPIEYVPEQYAWATDSSLVCDTGREMAVVYTPPPPTLEDFDAALTAHLDATAQARRYDNRITCALRAGYTGPFQAEGQAFATWMDACNWQAYQVLAGVQSGALTMPTVEEFVADLPDMVWPT